MTEANDIEKPEPAACPGRVDPPVGQAIIERRNHDFIAYIAGNKSLWESGYTEHHALSQLTLRVGMRLVAVRDQESYVKTDPCWPLHVSSI